MTPKSIFINFNFLIFTLVLPMPTSLQPLIFFSILLNQVNNNSFMELDLDQIHKLMALLSEHCNLEYLFHSFQTNV